MQKSNRILAIAIVTTFLADWVFKMVYHGYYMMDTYAAHKNLWRSFEAMQDLRPMCILSGLLISAMSALIFSKGYEGKGYMEGFRFGLLIGLVFVGLDFGSYTYLPITDDILLGWIVGSLLQGQVIGLTLAMIFGMKLEEGAKTKKAPTKSSKKK